MVSTGGITVVNLTPHPVDVLVDDRTIHIPVDGVPPRVSIHRVDVAEVEIDGASVPICESVLTSELTDLPGSRSGTLFIVSRIVAEHSPERTDLVFPDDLVRDSDGSIVGCRRLGRLPRSSL